jgi:hypothetical protein
MYYNKILEKISLNKEAVANGEYLGIPYPYERLNKHLSCMERGQAIGVLAGSGVGKSRFTRYTFLYHPYKFYKETGYKLRIIFFCMEDSKEMIYNFVVCNYLFDKYGIRITPKEVTSKVSELPDNILDKLVEAKEYFEEFETVVTFIDGEDQPKAMYNICKKVALKLGRIDKYNEVIEGEEVTQYKYESDTHVIAIFDNMSNISTDNPTESEQHGILTFVKEYMRNKLCNFFNWTCILVQQQDFESERQSFSKSGESIVAKLEPSLASIGDSKRSSRSLHLIFSLFAPHRHELPQYPLPSKHNPEHFYDITVLGNAFRSLRVIKSNYTETGMRVPLLFDGVTETFTELPQPKTAELAEVYARFRAYKTGQPVRHPERPNLIKIDI